MQRNRWYFLNRLFETFQTQSILAGPGLSTYSELQDNCTMNLQQSKTLLWLPQAIYGKKRKGEDVNSDWVENAAPPLRGRLKSARYEAFKLKPNGGVLLGYVVMRFE